MEQGLYDYRKHDEKSRLGKNKLERSNWKLRKTVIRISYFVIRNFTIYELRTTNPEQTDSNLKVLSLILQILLLKFRLRQSVFLQFLGNLPYIPLFFGALTGEEDT